MQTLSKRLQPHGLGTNYLKQNSTGSLKIKTQQGNGFWLTFKRTSNYSVVEEDAQEDEELSDSQLHLA